MSRPPVRVLLVDDDDVDREAVRRGLAESRFEHQLHAARDGLEALELLRGRATREPLPRPYLVLLDLNMPRMDGIAFLTELRRDPRLAATVVFVLTTSSSATDREIAYRHCVAGYISKATVGTDFARLAELLGRYWELVDLPG